MPPPSFIFHPSTKQACSLASGLSTNWHVVSLTYSFQSSLDQNSSHPLTFRFWCYLFHDAFSHLSCLYFCSILRQHRQHINVVIYRCTIVYLLQMFLWHSYWTTNQNFYFVICFISLLVCKVVKCSDCISFTLIFIHMVNCVDQMMTLIKKAVYIEE